MQSAFDRQVKKIVKQFLKIKKCLALALILYLLKNTQHIGQMYFQSRPAEQGIKG